MEHLLNTEFDSANDAFEYYLYIISNYGYDYRDTKALWNVGFYLKNPSNNIISNKRRNWKHDYAKLEFDWYLSGDQNAYSIAKHAKIWYKHMDAFGNVNSNYGFRWHEQHQLNNIIDKLKEDKLTRQAWITIYDGKQIKDSSATLNGYQTDTPCTLNVGFNIINDKLCMNVYMRSNDLWYGFCNDQYCFSSLQQIIANELKCEIGWYYHHANNLHIYNDKLLKLKSNA